jgi:uncharacterized membrane protein
MTFLDRYEKHLFVALLVLSSAIYWWLSIDLILEYNRFAEEHIAAQSLSPLWLSIGFYLTVAIFTLSMKLKVLNLAIIEADTIDKIRAILIFISGLIGAYSIVTAKLDIVQNNFRIETLEKSQQASYDHDANISKRIKDLEEWRQAIYENDTNKSLK